jgi:NADPH:quinone reductase-like Zn-dependent oxidoreductase
VTDLHVGDAVYGGAQHTYAEHVVAGAESTALKAATLSFTEAAAVPLDATTAWAAVESANLTAGSRVLIRGAAGGVGQFAVQFAKRRAVTLIGTTLARYADIARSLGVDQVIDYTVTPPEDVVRDLDAVIILVGGEVLYRSMPLVRQGGTLVSVVGEPSPGRAYELGIDARFPPVTITHELLARFARMRTQADCSRASVPQQHGGPGLWRVQRTFQSARPGRRRSRRGLRPAATPLPSARHRGCSPPAGARTRRSPEPPTFGQSGTSKVCHVRGVD